MTHSGSLKMIATSDCLFQLKEVLFWLPSMRTLRTRVYQLVRQLAWILACGHRLKRPQRHYYIYKTKVLTMNYTLEWTRNMHSQQYQTLVATTENHRMILRLVCFGAANLLKLCLRFSSTLIIQISQNVTQWMSSYQVKTDPFYLEMDMGNGDFSALEKQVRCRNGFLRRFVNADNACFLDSFFIF